MFDKSSQNYSGNEYINVVITRVNNFPGANIVEKALSYAGMMYGYVCGYQRFLGVDEDALRLDARKAEFIRSLFPCLGDLRYVSPYVLLERINGCSELRRLADEQIANAESPKYAIFFKIEHVPDSDLVKIWLTKSPFPTKNVKCRIDIAGREYLPQGIRKINVVFDGDKTNPLLLSSNDVSLSFLLELDFDVFWQINDVIRKAHFPVSELTIALGAGTMAYIAQIFLNRLIGYESVVLGVLRRAYELAFKWSTVARRVVELAELAT